MPVVWLTDVKPDDSVAWLSSLVTASPDTAAKARTRRQDGDAAIALHNAPAADRALESFVAPARPEWLRSDTAFWLGQHARRAGRAAAHPDDRPGSQR